MGVVVLDLVELDRRACELNFALIEGVSAAEWSAATPCVEWTVRDLVQHQVDSTAAFTAGARGESVDVVGEPLGADPLGVYQAAVADAWAAFDTAGMLDAEREFPGFGRRSGRTLVAAHFVDNLVHAWDLARALGREYEFEDDLASAALRITARYPAGIASFAPPVPVPGSASATDRLVGRLGRSPRWPA
ncbi:TIGR03086 family metal-binding protein [Umezawaea sp.]|uniref:TIGR03086 family metal-binding protein n=1 Tax=Umezawaea sp. TaxID=1955258 RepID=UPI002ED54F57